MKCAGASAEHDALGGAGSEEISERVPDHLTHGNGGLIIQGTPQQLMACYFRFLHSHGGTGLGSPLFWVSPRIS
jgi:hypothetical protein